MLCALGNSLPKECSIVDLPQAQQNLAALDAFRKTAHRPIIRRAAPLDRSRASSVSWCAASPQAGVTTRRCVCARRALCGAAGGARPTPPGPRARL